jgi:hypothetical protein
MIFVALERRDRRAGHWSSLASSGVIPPVVADSDGKLHENLDEESLGPENVIIPPPPDFERDETRLHREQMDAIRTWRYPFPSLRDSFTGYEGWLLVASCILLGSCALVAACAGMGAFSWPVAWSILGAVFVALLLLCTVVILVAERTRRRRRASQVLGNGLRKPLPQTTTSGNSHVRAEGGSGA